MKTFIEFLEEAYLVEMRKEDKVAGKKKTPLTIERTRTLTTRGSVRRSPEGSGNKWKVTPAKTETHTDVTGNPLVSTGRYRQGARGGSEYGYKRHQIGRAHV